MPLLFKASNFSERLHFSIALFPSVRMLSLISLKVKILMLKRHAYGIDIKSVCVEKKKNKKEKKEKRISIQRLETYH